VTFATSEIAINNPMTLSHVHYSGNTGKNVRNQCGAAIVEAYDSH